ncbi:DUF5655 domain-containing protein [Nocardia coubleae]|uniref:DUF5655 domain-containing protein n=1 Tax=Nocardia coubleae TaxID=356147 RepID=A0A846VYP6_9NOCA|nr:DUF5655 domain-containing protein [Nocardia coubleae]NKX85763.1 hypothetical protein [Nocardia coubleae]
MSDSVDPAVEAYFSGKPHSREIFGVLRELIASNGPVEVSVASQIVFAVARKFAWVWLYNVTGKNPEGTVQIMLALDREMAHAPVYRVTQVGRARWNHLVVVHSLDEARDPRLAELIAAAYRFGAK